MDEAQKAHISDIQARYSPNLMTKANVIGTAIGYRQQAGASTDEMVLVVLVNQKVPLDQLAPEDVIPKQIEDVPVDVQSVGGMFRAG